MPAGKPRTAILTPFAAPSNTTQAKTPLFRGFLSLGDGSIHSSANLSAAAQRYLDRLGLGVEDLFHHALAVLHDPAYREANAGALRMEWPRIPLPGWPDGETPGAADDLRAIAARGRELAGLLDLETAVAGVTAGTLRPELAAIAVPSTADGRNMSGRRWATPWTCSATPQWTFT